VGDLSQHARSTYGQMSPSIRVLLAKDVEPFSRLPSFALQKVLG
jgi:hypothetical protein